jgi:magnesium transporter
MHAGSQYGAESAGSLAVSNVPVAQAEETIGALRDRMLASRFDVIELVIVADPNGRYVGVADVRDVLSRPRETPVAAVLRADWPRVAPDTDQEHAAETATAAGVATLPVVSDNGEIHGCIPATALLRVLGHEHRQDVHRLVGIVHEGALARHALEDPPLRRALRRLPWLLVGLALSALAAAVMAAYERALQANVLIAIFIPSLVYLADAVGTQTEAIAVRGLSLRHRPLRALILNEVATGGLIGLGLAVPALFGVWAMVSDPRIALGVSVSLLVASMLASAIGLVLPWSLSRLRIDPAFGSGPVATIIQDVVTILLYFIVITSLLGL